LKEKGNWLNLGESISARKAWRFILCGEKEAPFSDKLFIHLNWAGPFYSSDNKKRGLFGGDYAVFLPNSSVHPFQASYDEVSCPKVSNTAVQRLHVQQPVQQPRRL
jgi:hypothetical protein